MNRSTEARRLRLLTDPIRLRMLGVIRESAGGRTHVGRLVDQVGAAQPTVSQHIRALVDDGVIECSTEGERVWCSIAPSAEGRVDELLRADVPAHAPDEVLARVASELADRFEGVFAPETVGRYVRESHDLLVARDDGARDAAVQTAQWAADRLVAVASTRSTRAADAPTRGAVRLRAELGALAARRGAPQALRGRPRARAQRRLQARRRRALDDHRRHSTRSGSRSAASSPSR